MKEIDVIGVEEFDLYPVTIMYTRYGGVYEGGSWVAFHRDPLDIPERSYGEDSTCAEFWQQNKKVCGIGDSPNEALEDLKEKHRRCEEIFCEKEFK